MASELVERLRKSLPYIVSATAWAEADALKAEAAARNEIRDAKRQQPEPE